MIKIDRPNEQQLSIDAELWDIYDQAFPADEKEPNDVILSAVSKRLAVIIRAQDTQLKTHNNSTVGFAMVHIISRPKMKFLVYVATSHSVRGRGIGSRLLAEVVDWKVAESTVAEVDDPDLADGLSDREIRRRRLAFFEKAGFVQLKKDYWQPPLTKDSHAVRMLMMAQGPIAFSAEDAIKGIYKEAFSVVNCLPGDVLDDLFRRMFNKHL